MNNQDPVSDQPAKRTKRLGIDVIPERALIAADRDQTIDLLIRVIPPDAETQIDRPNLNLSIVLDRSGSMGGAKIAHARSAAACCVDQLLATDRISLVIFDDVIEVLVPSQLAENREAIKERFSRITARNSTALHEAWVKGGIEVSKHLAEGAINRVLLITDGLANVGVTNIDTIVSQASEVAARGVSTSTIGIGSDFNEDLLIPMAEAGRGNAWHVVEPQDMERIFESELKGLIAQIAHTVSLGLTPADGVRIQDMLNDFDVTHTGRYKLPNLRAGSPLDVVARLKVPAHAAETRLKVLDLRLAWNPQGAPSSEREVIGKDFTLEFAPLEEVANQPVDDRVTRAVQLLMAARARREAIDQLDRGDIVGARATVAGTAQMMAQACAPYIEDAQIQEQMQALSDLGAELVAGRDMKGSRKKLSYQAYLTRLSKSLKQ